MKPQPFACHDTTSRPVMVVANADGSITLTRSDNGGEVTFRLGAEVAKELARWMVAVRK